jgi:hypothetical protein
VQIGPTLRPRAGLHYNKTLGKWILPFHGSDASVVWGGGTPTTRPLVLVKHRMVRRTYPQVRRTQAHLYEAQGLSPVQFGAYVGIQLWRNAALMVVFGALFAKLAAYGWGRSLLLNVCALISLGKVRARP